MMADDCCKAACGTTATLNDPRWRRALWIALGVNAGMFAVEMAAGAAADSRALARALRVGGKVEPVFVERIDDLPQAIRDVARDGDVIMTMGAGSIGSVPGKLAAA